MLLLKDIVKTNDDITSLILKKAQEKAYELVNKVSFENSYHRKDIGYKGIYMGVKWV